MNGKQRQSRTERSAFAVTAEGIDHAIFDSRIKARRKLLAGQS
jgi:hypothetical protein